MRLIGHLPNESTASTFSDYLYVEGITNVLESEKDGWAVWIHSEDEWTRAKELLSAFLGNPADPKYRKQAAQARDLKSQAAARQEEADSKLLAGTEVARATMPYRVGPLSMVFIGLSLAVQLLRLGGYDEQVLRELYMTVIEFDGNYFKWSPGLVEVSQGEVWRLFTPVIVPSVKIMSSASRSPNR